MSKIMFSREQLSGGYKLHIRGNGNSTLCGLPNTNSPSGLIGVREDYKGLCRRCVRIFKARRKQAK